jgi:DNA-binding CsgD family transcriptional regulator
MNGEQYFSKYFDATAYESFLLKQKLLPLPRFSDRERKLVELISIGKTSFEIGQLMNLTTNTVETYRTRVIEKAHVKNSTELVDFFHRNGVF